MARRWLLNGETARELRAKKSGTRVVAGREKHYLTQRTGRDVGDKRTWREVDGYSGLSVAKRKTKKTDLENGKDES